MSVLPNPAYCGLYALLKSRLITEPCEGITIRNSLSERSMKVVSSGYSLKLWPINSCKLQVCTMPGAIPQALQPIRPRRLSGKERDLDGGHEIPDTCGEKHDIFGVVYDTVYTEVRMTESCGLGVFARVDIPRKTLITEYAGSYWIIRCKDDVPEGHNSHSVSLMHRTTCIYGVQRPIPGWGVGSLINASSRGQNVRLKKDVNGGRAYVYASKDITAGTELLWNYSLQ